MELKEYPRPPADTGWGFHDSAGADCRPTDPVSFARYLRQDLGISWFKALARGTGKVELARTFAKAGIEVVVRLYAPRPHPRHVVSPAEVAAAMAQRKVEAEVVPPEKGGQGENGNPVPTDDALGA